MAKFKKEVLDKIGSDPGLFAAVASELGIKPTSLQQVMLRNGNSINRYSVVRLVAEYLGENPDNLVEMDSKVIAQS